MSPKTWTAAELESMEPSEVDARFQESIVRDLDEVPVEFLDVIRADIHDHIASAEASPRQ